MKKAQGIDNIIEQIKQGIIKNEKLILRENIETEIGRNKVEYYKGKIIELEYRIRELEKKKVDSSSILIPEYGDGKYSTDSFKEALDMLRVLYYKYFNQDPTLLYVPKMNMMFYDSTLYIPVNTYLVKGKIPFHIMYTGSYHNYKPNNTQSISIEIPFDILSKDENEEYLKYMLDLIQIYSGEQVNFVLGNGTSTHGMLSYISDEDLLLNSSKDLGYYDFFERLHDNNVWNIIYVGDSMKNGLSHETIEKVEKQFIDCDKRIISNNLINGGTLDNLDEKIKKHILSINKKYI